jgi:F-type H+-transporting ATPase subunit b
MEIFKTFGLEPTILVGQIVNFLIILYILKRFLYKPLFRILQKREELVRSSIQKAEESTKALEKAQDEEKEIIKNAQTTANQIIKDAKEQSKEMIVKTEEATKKKTEKMLSDAKDQIELEKKKTEAELNNYVSTLALALLQKSLDNVFTDKEQSAIMQRATKEIQNNAN